MVDFTAEQTARLRSCSECPRKCGANRFESKGYCASPPVPKLSSANLHHGEEPPISGSRGSGTIFFAGCNLSCVFCQNYPLSQLGHGTELTLDGLVSAMLKLQSRGAHNINFVTPSHATIALESAIATARDEGLSIPIVYNTSGYDSLEQLKRLEGLVDIYMPDIRYRRAEIAKKLSNAEDYPVINLAALREMHRQVGDLVFDDDEIATKGLLVRHLVLPGGIADTAEALRFIAEEISPNTYVSLMAQYFPAYKAVDMASINRRLTKAEWRTALEAFRRSDLNGWAQEYEAG
jgi:putative pyruvate formate lyase activating enzyme